MDTTQDEKIPAESKIAKSANRMRDTNPSIIATKAEESRPPDSAKAPPSPPPVKKKRKSPAVPWKKPKDMPKRPLSAYNLFFKDERSRMLASGTVDDEGSRPTRTSGIGFANLAKTIAAKWKSLDAPTKAPYEEKAAKDKKRYDEAVAIWRSRQPKGKSKKSKTSQVGEETRSPNEEEDKKVRSHSLANSPGFSVRSDRSFASFGGIPSYPQDWFELGEGDGSPTRETVSELPTRQTRTMANTPLSDVPSFLSVPHQQGQVFRHQPDHQFRFDDPRYQQHSPQYSDQRGQSFRGVHHSTIHNPHLYNSQQPGQQQHHHQESTMPRHQLSLELTVPLLPDSPSIRQSLHANRDLGTGHALTPSSERSLPPPPPLPLPNASSLTRTGAVRGSRDGMARTPRLSQRRSMLPLMESVSEMYESRPSPGSGTNPMDLQFEAYRLHQRNLHSPMYSWAELGYTRPTGDIAQLDEGRLQHGQHHYHHQQPYPILEGHQIYHQEQPSYQHHPVESGTESDPLPAWPVGGPAAAASAAVGGLAGDSTEASSLEQLRADLDDDLIDFLTNAPFS